MHFHRLSTLRKVEKKQVTGQTRLSIIAVALLLVVIGLAISQTSKLPQQRP